MSELTYALKEAYVTSQPVAAARALEAIPDRLLAASTEGLSPRALVGVLDALPSSRTGAVFTSLNTTQQLGVLQDSSPRLAILLLNGLSDELHATLFAALPPPLREDLERLQRFDENTAGRLMDPPFDAIRVDMSVAEALQVLRDSGLRSRRSFYVVDSGNRLVGKVDMQALALAEPHDRLSDMLDELEGSVLATAGREEIVGQLDRYRVDSIPVVDLEGRLMGIVRYKRLFEAIESVASADLQKMVGVSADERALSSATFAIKRRLPWLHINLLTAFLAAAVVGLFESLIAQFTALAILLPVVAGQSGNAGSQALAVTIRGLALREITTREWRKVLGKETRVGIADGLALAVTCGLGVFLWSQSAGLAMVIAVAMILSMVAAGVSGALVPILLTRLGQDPATASSIILTTVTDVAGFMSFLGTATLMSSML